MNNPDIAIRPPEFLSRYSEDKMMSAYRSSAQIGVEDKADAKNARAIMKERRRAKKAAERASAPVAETTSPKSPLPFPTFRHVSAAERRKERLPEDAAFFAKIYEERRAEVAYRLKHGFVQTQPVELSGVSISGVKENGLRSNGYNGKEYKTLERWPSLVPRASTLRTSTGNTTLETKRIKILALDEPYVEGNRDMLGFIRLDTDRVWPSVASATHAFKHVAREGKVACPPNLLVGLVDSEGRFIRPHAIWLLPFSDKTTPGLMGPVLNMPSSKGFRKAPLDLFRAVYFGLVSAHLELGADANAPSTTQQVKNPLSPFWTTVVVNDDICQTLGVHAQYLDLKQTKEKIVRESAKLQSGQPLSVSNGLFNAFQKTAFSTLAAWHFSGDVEYQNAMQSGRRVGLLADRIHESFERLDLGSLKASTTREQVASIAAKVADYAARNWDPEKLAKPCNRGTLMAEVEGVPRLADRQAIAARFATEKLMDAKDELIIDAVRLMMMEGQDVTRKALARTAGVALGTVKSRWQMVERLIG